MSVKTERPPYPFMNRAEEHILLVQVRSKYSDIGHAYGANAVEACLQREINALEAKLERALTEQIAYVNRLEDKADVLELYETEEFQRGR